MTEVQKKAYLINAWNDGEANYMIILSEPSEDALEASIDARLKQAMLCGVDCVDHEELSTARDLSVLSKTEVEFAKKYFTDRLVKSFWNFDHDQSVAKFLPEPFILEFNRDNNSLRLMSRGLQLIGLEWKGPGVLEVLEEEPFKNKSLKLLQILLRVADKVDQDLIDEANLILEQSEHSLPRAEADIDDVNVALI